MNDQSDYRESPLFKYLASEGCIPNITSLSLTEFHNQILTLFKDKSSELVVMAQDLTKCRCELMKANKQLKELQDKSSMGAANSNNTGSSFMMPSEFKAQFQSFMKQTVSSSLCAITHRPQALTIFLQHLLSTHYILLETRLSELLNEITSVLHLPESTSPAARKLLFTQLLKILQDNHAQLFSIQKSSVTLSLNEYFTTDSDFKQIIDSADFQQMMAELNRLIAYMLLQENKWEFIIPSKKMIEFNKKECTCIDGWVKEKDQVLVVVEGLKRDSVQGSVHPNLKNFVIPMAQEEENIPVIEKIDELKGSITTRQMLMEPPRLSKRMSSRSEDRPQFGLVSTLSLQLEPTKIITAHIETAKSSEISMKKQQSEQTPTEAQLERRLRIYTDEAPIKLKVSNDAHLDLNKKKKVGAGKIAGLLSDPNFSEVLVFPKQRTKREELTTSRPSLDQQLQSRIINRQHQIRKQTQDKRQDRIKKQKSIGRIISQLSKLSLREEHRNESVASSTHLRCSSNKQNQSGNILKEAVYKEIIRNKFKEDKSVLKIRENEKKQAMAFGDPFVAKTERLNKEVDQNRKREQNRPLKPSQEHMKRVREKHHLLF